MIWRKQRPSHACNVVYLSRAVRNNNSIDDCVKHDCSRRPETTVLCKHRRGSRWRYTGMPHVLLTEFRPSSTACRANGGRWRCRWQCTREWMHEWLRRGVCLRYWWCDGDVSTCGMIWARTRLSSRQSSNAAAVALSAGVLRLTASWLCTISTRFGTGSTAMTNRDVRVLWHVDMFRAQLRITRTTKSSTPRTFCVTSKMVIFGSRLDFFDRKRLADS